MAFSDDYRFGVSVSCGDLDGDGMDELITAPGPGAESHYVARVLGWNYDGQTLEQIAGLNILAYDEETRYGARLATGPIAVDLGDGAPAPTKLAGGGATGTATGKGAFSMAER